MSFLYDDLNKLSDISDDESLSSLSNHNLEIESDYDDITSSDGSEADYNVTSQNRFRKDNFVLNQTESTNKYASNYSNGLILNPNLLRQRSKSEANIAYSTAPKKRLSADINLNGNGLQTPALFRLIGNWFRGSFRNLSNIGSSSTSLNTDSIEPTKTILKPQLLAKSEVGTPFGKYEKPEHVYDRRVVKFTETFDDEDTKSDTSESLVEDEQSEEECQIADVRATKSGTELDQEISECTKDVGGRVRFRFRSPNPFQCSNWEHIFRGCSEISIECKDLDEDLDADALVFPGNSFGILDGEPEASYVDILGDVIAKMIQDRIREEHDGELLVGQAVLLPNLPLRNGLTSQSDVSSESEVFRGIRHLIYVPVMRVPSLVAETVNAYLAFRAVILAVNSHNSGCDEESRIETVICPALCGGIGRMPCPRVAHQMKTAYDVFAAGKLPDLQFPSDLGTVASNHVAMTSIKKGSWC